MIKNNVFITGISTGLGLSLAQEYLKLECEVYGISRREPNSLLGEGGIHFLKMDLENLALIENQIGSLLESVENLQLLILNAAVLGEIKDMPEQSLEKMKKVMDVNVWSNKVILDAIIKRGIGMEQVVAISSGAAVKGHRGWEGYAISKAALNMLTQLYAVELPQTHFTALAPGLVDTAMQEFLCGSVDEQKFQVVQILKSARNTDAMPQPQEAAQKISQLIPKLRDYQSGAFVDIRDLSA